MLRRLDQDCEASAHSARRRRERRELRGSSRTCEFRLMSISVLGDVPMMPVVRWWLDGSRHHIMATGRGRDDTFRRKSRLQRGWWMGSTISISSLSSLFLVFVSFHFVSFHSISSSRSVLHFVSCVLFCSVLLWLCIFCLILPP